MTTQEMESLNRLQDAGIISDNCVTWDDIATADLERAKEFLNEND